MQHVQLKLWKREHIKIPMLIGPNPTAALKIGSTSIDKNIRFLHPSESHFSVSDSPCFDDV